MSSDQIRTREVTAATGIVADSPVVRRGLADLQRAIAAGRDLVCEGRDQGTIVFPDAFCKFFLVGRPRGAARRRQTRTGRARRRGRSGGAAAGAGRARPARRRPRAWRRWSPPPTPWCWTARSLTLEEVVDRMEPEVRRRWPAAGAESRRDAPPAGNDRLANLWYRMHATVHAWPASRWASACASRAADNARSAAPP